MPAAMTRPIEKRALAPAPDAMISGTTPSTMAAVVIRIGRSRTRAASTIASRFGQAVLLALLVGELAPSGCRAW